MRRAAPSSAPCTRASAAARRRPAGRAGSSGDARGKCSKQPRRLALLVRERMRGEGGGCRGAAGSACLYTCNKAGLAAHAHGVLLIHMLSA
eukprot:365823-Chlamydomonas_euryale.AAC.1